METQPYRVLLGCEVIVRTVFQTLSELYILSQKMNAPVAIPFAHGAIAFNSYALLLAFRLLRVEWR
jgi:hypothetical protein